MKATHIDIDKMKQLYSYDPETGVIVRKIDRGDAYKSGQIAGTLTKQGYIVIKLNGRLFGAHRLAWALHFGEQPKGIIDHRNGVKSDNRIKNLRDGSRVLNAQNLRSGKTSSKTGLLGVCERNGKFVAVIHKDGKQTYLGSFCDKDSAHAAYLDAKRVIHEGCTI